MIFDERTTSIFQSVYDRLKPFHALVKKRTAIIAYSGGKDSTLLARFYQYLFLNAKCPEPILFHFDHSIRDNAEQEKEIELEMKKISNKSIIKKKYSKAC